MELSPGRYAGKSDHQTIPHFEFRRKRFDARTGYRRPSTTSSVKSVEAGLMERWHCAILSCLLEANLLLGRVPDSNSVAILPSFLYL